MEISPDNWEAVKSLFEAAQELAPEEIPAFLAQNCTDSTLRAEVERLLAQDRKAGDFLLAPALAGFRLEPERPPAQFRAGELLAGRFRIIRFIAAGGMGEVYEAEDVELKADRAIKIIRPEILNQSNAVARFRREVRLAQQVTHPNVCRVFDIFRHKSEASGMSDVWLVSMELLHGVTLADRLKKEGRMSLREALPLINQICSALGAAHHAGISHRDFKPSNVILVVSKDDASCRVVVTDFGLAVRSVSSTETTSPTTGSELFGSPAYMAPEQIERQVTTPVSDIYALGLVMYEMVSGKRPFEGDTPLSVAVKRLTQNAPSPRHLLPQLPPRWETVILRCLEREPAKRFTNVEEIADALSGEGGPVPVSSTMDLQRQKRGTESRLVAATSSWTAPVAHAAQKVQNKSLRKIIVLAVVMLVAALIGSGVYYYLSNPTKLLTEKDTIVLADFDNSTGDPIFDYTLRTALSMSLGQSPFLNVLSDSKVATTLQLMTRPTDTKLIPEVAREVCQRAGSTVYLEGSVVSMGNKYVLTLKAVACQGGDTLAQEQVTAASKEKVLQALDEAASKLRSELDDRSVKKFHVPIEAMTSSLEALQSYSMGVTTERETGDAASVPFFQQAIELDTNFTMAYAELATLYGNLSQPSLGLLYATKAYQLRERVNKREKLRISALYFHARGEVDREVETYKLWIENYPRDFVPHSRLGANYVDMGQYDKAVAQYREALRLAPEDDVLNYRDLGASDVSLNRLEEAKANFDKAVAHELDSGLLRVNLYCLAFLRGDVAQMEQQVASAMGGPDEDQLLSLQSDTEAYYGRMSKARDFSGRAVGSAVLNDDKATAALWQVNAALRDAELGNAALARQEVAKALVLSWTRDVEVVAALTQARAGDARAAKALAEDLEKMYPTDTLLKLYWLPTIRAAIELNEGNSSQALEDLKATAPYELGQAGMFINYAYPAYVRGQVYLLQHDGAHAAAEFRKLKDHKGIVGNFVTGSLARLQIGRAYAITGDTAASKAAYQDFFAIWKDADPDIRILKEAKAEYATRVTRIVGINNDAGNSGDRKLREVINAGDVAHAKIVFPGKVSLGQTTDQVEANFGKPKIIANLGSKIIYVYPDMKVTFVDGKVIDVQ
jgi:serine/threonine protein kinase/tetratricopeptide (TPR) repeat protein